MTIKAVFYTKLPAERAKIISNSTRRAEFERLSTLEEQGNLISARDLRGRNLILDVGIQCLDPDASKSKTVPLDFGSVEGSLPRYLVSPVLFELEKAAFLAVALGTTVTVSLHAGVSHGTEGSSILQIPLITDKLQIKALIEHLEAESNWR